MTSREIMMCMIKNVGDHTSIGGVETLSGGGKA